MSRERADGKRFSTLLDPPLRYLFGRDLFISYSRADASGYGTSLANRLRAELPTLSIYMDRWIAPPAGGLSRSLRRAVRWSSILVLVGSEGAVRSAFVQSEIVIFARTRRQLIPIDVGGALSTVDWESSPWSAVRGAAREEETLAALVAGSPSETVVERIKNSLVFTRQNQRLSRAVRATTGAVVLLMAGATWVSNAMIREAGSRAETAEDRAAAARAREVTANGEARLAQLLRDEANTQAGKARELELLAEQNTDRQRRLARANLYTSHINQSFLALQREDFPRLASLLDQQRPAPGAEDLRGFEWYYLSQLAHGETLKLRGPDEAMVAFAGRDLLLIGGESGGTFNDPRGAVALHSLPSGELRGRLEHPRPVGGLAVSPDGEFLATILDTRREDDPSGALLLWRLADRTLRREIHVPQHLHSVALARDGRTVAAGAEDGSVLFFDSESGRQVRILRHPGGGWVRSLAVSPDGRLMAAALDDPLRKPQQPGEAVVWDLDTGQTLLRQTVPKGSDRFWHVEISRDGKSLLAAGNDTVRRWSLATGEEETAIQAHEGPIDAIAQSPDGKTLVTAGWDRRIRLWDTMSGEPILALPKQGNPISSAAFSPDDVSIAVADTDGVVHLWAARQLLATQTLLRAHRTVAMAVAVSPDGRTFATGGDEGIILLWRLGERQPFRQIEHAPQGGDRQQLFRLGVTALSFSPDGRFLAAAGREGGKIYDLAGGPPRTLRVDFEPFTVVFAPRGRHLAIGGEKGLAVWDLTSGRRWTHPAPSASSLAFSPDGRVLAVGGTLQLLDASTGRMVRKLEDYRCLVLSLAFSPEGSKLLAGCSDGTARLWDVASGRESAVLANHNEGVRVVAFSPDGKTLATGNTSPAPPATAFLKLWNSATGQELVSLPTQMEGIWSLAFSPNGRFIVTTGGDRQVGEPGKIKLWTTESR
jgi:WD40 repeat protein